MSKIFGERQPGQVLRQASTSPFFESKGLVQRDVPQPRSPALSQALIEGALAGSAAGITCPILDSGTLSEVSWGETSGLYPSSNDKYQPDKWDAGKTCDLLKARRAIYEVSQRGQKTHKGKPNASDKIEQMLKKYHFVENFPVADVEINDAEVKWFYLSNDKNKPSQHPSLGSKANSIVKTYGPFYNNGGGDVGKGDTYIHFYKLDSATPAKPPAKK